MQSKQTTPIQHVIYETNTNEAEMYADTRKNQNVSIFQNSLPLPGSKVYREKGHQQVSSQPSFLLSGQTKIHQQKNNPLRVAPNIQNRPDLWNQIAKMLRSPQNKHQEQRSQQSLFNLAQENKQSFILQQQNIPQNSNYQNQIKFGHQYSQNTRTSNIPILKYQIRQHPQLLKNNEQNRARAKAFTEYYPNQAQSHTHYHQAVSTNQIRDKAISGYHPNQVHYHHDAHHHNHSPPKSFSRFQYIPIKKKIVQFQTRQVSKTIWVPVMKEKVDYYQIEHLTQYEVVPYQQTIIQQIPIQKCKTKVQYQLVEKKIIHLPDSCYDREENCLTLSEFEKKNMHFKPIEKKITMIDSLKSGKDAFFHDSINQLSKREEKPSSIGFILDSPNKQKPQSIGFILDNQNTMTKKQQKRDSAEFILDSHNSGIKKTVGFVLDDQPTPNRNSNIKINTSNNTGNW